MNTNRANIVDRVAKNYGRPRLYDMMMMICDNPTTRVLLLE